MFKFQRYRFTSFSAHLNFNVKFAPISRDLLFNLRPNHHPDLFLPLRQLSELSSIEGDIVGVSLLRYGRDILCAETRCKLSKS